jgi:hypothetical protein
MSVVIGIDRIKLGAVENARCRLPWVRNATRVPENPGNPPVFKPVNPGLNALKNPGLTGLISAVYTVQKSGQQHKQKGKGEEISRKKVKINKYVTVRCLNRFACFTCLLLGPTKLITSFVSLFRLRHGVYLYIMDYVKFRTIPSDLQVYINCLYFVNVLGGR